ncbi:MAG: GNAT family N-acetyltransferase [Marinicellaceae bacterium]
MKTPNSNRLSYQLMDEHDAALLFELDQDPQVMHFINGGKPTTQKELEEIYVPRMKSYTNPDKGWGLWKVNLIENGEFIGWVLVRPMDFFSDNKQIDNLELGWRFMQKSWGQGYATEAALSIKNALTENKCANKYTAIAVSENIASIGIMKKLGMKFIKKDIHKDPLGDMEVEYYECLV